MPPRGKSPWTGGRGSVSRDGRAVSPRARDPSRISDETPVLAGRLEPLDRAGDVRVRAVLAELPLALDPVDDELDADDRLQLALDVRLRRVVHRPGLLARRLVPVAQRAHVGLDPGRVVVDDQPAVDVRGDVVPRRDDAAVLALRRVPGRRDVGVGTAHDRHRVADRGHLPLAVVARDMAVEDAPDRPRPAPGSIQSSGSIVASRPSAVAVIRSAAPRFRSSSRTSSSSGWKWAGTYIVEAWHDDAARRRLSPGRVLARSRAPTASRPDRRRRCGSPHPNRTRPRTPRRRRPPHPELASDVSRPRPTIGPARWSRTSGPSPLATWSRNASALIVPVSIAASVMPRPAPPPHHSSSLRRSANAPGTSSRTQPAWLIRTGRRR